MTRTDRTPRLAAVLTAASLFLAGAQALAEDLQKDEPRSKRPAADQPTDIVMLGDPDAASVVIEAHRALQKIGLTEKIGRLGFADGPRERVVDVFCRDLRPELDVDLLALAGRLTVEEFAACGRDDLVEIPLGARHAPDTPPQIVAAYVKSTKTEAKPELATFAEGLATFTVAGAGGAISRLGLQRQTEDARKALADRVAALEPVSAAELATPLRTLAPPRRAAADLAPGEAASTRLMITGIGDGARATVSVARAFAEARGAEAPEAFYRFPADAVSMFCEAENTALPDILVLDRRMRPEEYTSCQENGFLWITELFLGHAPPTNGSYEHNPVFAYYKKAHADALPTVQAFLEHLVSEAVLGADGLFVAEGLAPPAPGVRIALERHVENPGPLLSTAEFDRPIPEPYLASKTPDWANGQVVDGPRYALVIGNAAYSDAMGPLANPINDAEALAAALESVGFEVSLHRDLDFKGMRRALRDFSETLRGAPKDSTALFFFSGHGMQTNGLNYLAPVDAEIEAESDIEVEALSANLILSQIEEAGLALNLLFLDACRNNRFLREARSTTRGLAPIKAENNTLIVYATRPGEVAYDGEGGNSPFTEALVGAIAQPGVPVEFAMKDVARSVREATEMKQSPWIEGVLLNNFYFTPPG